jgi:hypothetical protein
MDEGIVEGSEDTGDAKNHFTYEQGVSQRNLRTALEMRTFANLRA